jgi:Glycoside hydrolase family 44
MFGALLLALILPSATTADTPATVTIDAAVRQPISPYIYGVNFPNWTRMRVPFTLARMGGNRLTAYNWENNASNAGNDWHNQNDGQMGRTNEPGAAIRAFLEDTQAHGAAALLTIQTIGHVAADKNPPGDVNLTPDYLNVRFVPSYPKKPGGHFVYPPDPTLHAVYEDEQVWWLEKIKSPATPVWYMLDNEPDIWAGTHARLQTTPLRYADLIAINLAYASAIKEVAPGTLVFGPANYGWNGFRTLQGAPDANGRDFLDVYLDAMKAAAAAQGRRLLDVLDIHWYPEARGDGIRITDSAPGDAALAAARIQAPRSLWDPTYVEHSWIANSIGHRPIVLLPAIQGQIARHYPGTKFSISEYNYGGGNEPSGLLAQADVLGLFGRYGLFAACNWGVRGRDAAMLAGFRAFLDYDGQGARFGDTGLAVSGETPAANSVYAALDSAHPNRLTVVVLNKTAAPTPLCLALKNFAPKTARAFTRADGAYDQPQASAPTVADGNVRLTLPPLSVTTVQIDE